MSFKNLNTQELVDLINSYVSEVRKLEYQIQRTQITITELESMLEERTSGDTGFITLPVETPTTTEPEKPKKRRGRPPKKKTEEAADKPKKRRGRPPKKKTEEAADKPKKRRGRPPKKKTAAVEASSQPKKKRGRPPKKAAEASSAVEKAKEAGSGYRLSEWDLFILNSIDEAQQVLVNADLMEKAQKKVQKEKLDMNEQQLRGKLNRSLHKLANKRGSLVKVDYPGKGFAYGLPSWTDSSDNIKKKYLKQ